MHVRINGQEQTITPGTTVSELLRTLDLEKKPCAVEVNCELVPKSQHVAHVLQTDDSIEMVTLVGGG